MTSHAEAVKLLTEQVKEITKQIEASYNRQEAKCNKCCDCNCTKICNNYKERADFWYEQRQLWSDKIEQLERTIETLQQES